MEIDRVLYPVTSLGPGDRLVIWVIGCGRRCAGCANPELWHKDAGKNISVNDLVRMIKEAASDKPIDGVTITGGDPLDQTDELCILLQSLREITCDIIMYTGYTYDEAAGKIPAALWEVINQCVSVLIDGPYVDALNDNSCVLRGSANQKIIFLDESKRGIYTEYLKNGRTIQNVYYKDKMISVGIHSKEISYGD